MILGEKKFSLSTIIWLFILLDISIFFYVDFIVIFILIITEISWFIGLSLGLRGQGHAKIAMFKLLSIADDPKYDDHEELRGHKLKQQIRHDVLEYDAWWMKKSIKKKTKNKRGVTMALKEKTIIEIMRAIALMWVSFGLGLTDILIYFGLSPLWIMAIVGVYYVIDLFFWLIMENEYGIFREEIDDG